VHIARSMIVGLTCPSSTHCVALDNAGNVLSTSDPSGGWRAWHKAPIDAEMYSYSTEAPNNPPPYNLSPLSLTAISCPTARFCAAVDTSGHVLTSR
jgi:hypothetical protein